MKMEQTASPAQSEFCELACCTGFPLAESQQDVPMDTPNGCRQYG